MRRVSGALPAGRQGLSERRRSRRRRSLVALLTLFVLVVGGALYGLRQEAVRISHITVFGVTAERQDTIADLAMDAIQGQYLGIIPRDSIFFFPERRIRAGILATYDGIAAVSIFRSGFTGLSIKIDERAPLARWCGLAPTPDVDEYCYVFDANGLIFAAAATTTGTINVFTLYAPLVDDAPEPLKATIAHADELPATFDFARQLATLGAPVTKIVIHDGEVDDYLASGTRLTYVLGDEQNAYTALMSARGSLALTDGSLEYVDLRFDGRVYLKKKE